MPPARTAPQRGSIPLRSSTYPIIPPAAARKRRFRKSAANVTAPTEPNVHHRIARNPGYPGGNFTAGGRPGTPE